MRGMGWIRWPPFNRPTNDYYQIKFNTIDTTVFAGGQVYYQPVIYDLESNKRVNCGIYLEERYVEKSQPWKRSNQRDQTLLNCSKAALAHDLVKCRQSCEIGSPINTETDLNYSWNWLVTFEAFNTLHLQYTLPQLYRILSINPSALLDRFSIYTPVHYAHRFDDDGSMESNAAGSPQLFSTSDTPNRSEPQLHIKYFPHSLPCYRRHHGIGMNDTQHTRQSQITPSPISYNQNIQALEYVPATVPPPFPLGSATKHNQNRNTANTITATSKGLLATPTRATTPLPTLPVAVDLADTHNNAFTLHPSTMRKRYYTRSTPATRDEEYLLEVSRFTPPDLRLKKQKYPGYLYPRDGSAVTLLRFRKQVKPKRSFFE